MPVSQIGFFRSLGLSDETTEALARAGSELDVASVMRSVVRTMTGADGATVVFKRGNRVAYVDEDAISPLWKGQDFPIEACISGWAIMHRQIVAISNIYDDERIPAPAYKPTFVNSLMMAPVGEGDPVAAIGAYWAEPHRATATELQTLEALARLTDTALRRVRVMTSAEAA